MNVWIVNHYAIPPSMGGLVRHYYFSKYLQKKGHTVKIFTSSKIHNTDINMIKDKSLYREEMEDGVEYTFVRSRDYKGNGIDRIVNMIDLPFKMWKAMKRFWKKKKPDVIYTSSPDLFVAFFALLFGKRHRVPVVVEIRDLWPESIVEYVGMSKRNPIIKVLYMLEKWIYRKANQLIFTIPGGKDYIIDKKWDKKVDLKKVNYINNGVDLEEYFKEKSIGFTDEDLDNNKFKVVYVGSIRQVNNVRALVKVAERLQRRGETDIQLLIYGDGTEKARLEEYCKNQGLTNIVFKGKVDKKKVPYILSKSNLNLLNYKQAATWKYGGSQNKQFEYLASGRPICSNVKMGHSIIEKYQCGLERDIISPDQYVEAILYFKNMDSESYEEMCKNAIKASQEFDYNRLGELVEATLIKAIS